MQNKKIKLEEPHQSRGIDQNIQQGSEIQSSIQLPLQKRKARFDNEFKDNPKRVRMDGEDDYYYHKRGLVHSLHGNIYQLKLQMLFLKRVLDKGYEFNLGTEVEDAEKFDDIYKRKDESGKNEIRFVQAKHKQDESKRITAHNLSTDKGDDFSLQKYFISYSKIKKKYGFNKSEFKDFIIYTNIKFDSVDLEKAEIKIEDIETSDDILVTKSGRSAVCKKIIIQKEHKVYEKLRETSDLYLLAKKLGQHIFSYKPLQLNADIFKLYHVPLCRTVFQIQETQVMNKEGKEIPKKYVTFRNDFLNGDNLAEDVSNFRNVLQLVLKRGNDDNAFQQDLKGKEFGVSLNFGEVFKSESNPIITEPEKLAETLAEIIHESNENIIKITRRRDVIKANIDKLAGHIVVQDEIDTQLMRFRELFFNDDNKLPGNLEEFKSALKQAFEMKETDFNVLRQYKYKISNFKTCEGKLLYSKFTLPNDKVTDEEIKEFFEKLVFAVGQPNEIDLGEIISKEIGEDSQFNLLNTDLVCYSFQGKILEWFKKKCPQKGKEGVWLNMESGKEFFNSIERQVNTLMSVGLSLSSFEKLQGYGIRFDVKKLLNTLKSFLSKESNIFHIITSEKTILSAINVYSVLAKLKNQEGFEQYNKDDGYIFMRLSTLLRPKTKKHVINSFKSKDSHNLLIVDCKSAALQTQVQEIDGLYNNLNEIISSNKNKKVIFISTKNDDAIAKKFATNSTKYKSEVDSSDFCDLTKGSQQKLLKQEIILQGEKISLNKLIDKVDGNVERIIDVKTLVQLISNEEIEIGSKPPGLSDLEGTYSELFEEVNIGTLVDKLSLEESRNIYLISGIPGSDKKDKLIQILNRYIEQSKVNDLKNQIRILNQQDIMRATNQRIQVADDQFKEKDFKQICHNNPERKIYWIILRNGGDKSVFILAQIYNPDFYLEGQRFNNEVVIEKNIKEQFGSFKPAEIFIIAVKDKNDFTGWLEFTDNQFEQNQLIWCKTHGSLKNLSKYRCNNYRNTKPLISEDDLIKELKDKKVSIISGDPGMGKSTTLVKLYGLKYELQSGIEESIIKSHWVIRINLKDHLEVIKNIDFSNSNLKTEITKQITEFLSQVDKTLSDGFARRLLDMALVKKHFTKPLLIAFDGFDEILDEVDRDKIISLFTRLKDTTETKFWITTRLQYEATLEGALATFAFRLDPMDDLTINKFIKKYLSNRLSLMLHRNDFKDIFENNDEVIENGRMQEYTQAFLNKMCEVFKGDVSKFIGTPLQLYLMLEGSTGHFKEWILTGNGQSTDFSYLDNDIWKVYQNFIDRKYKTYFKKADVTVELRKKQDKATFDGYHKDLAKSFILKSAQKKSLEEFKDVVLSAGIVRSDGSNIDFIHPTFKEYFATAVLIQWIRKWTEENHYVLVNPKKQEYFLKRILLQPDYQAAQENNVGIARFVLDNFQKANIEVTENAGNTVLHTAAKFGANINDKDASYKTVLHTAAESRNWDIVEFLVTEGASVNARDEHCKTVLHRAAESGATVNAKDAFNNTVLHTAAKSGNYDIVQFLVTEGAKVDAVDDIGNTVLHNAVLSHNLNIIQVLVSKSANVDATNEDGVTVLYRAAECGNMEILQFLVAKGANVNAANKYGQTILHWAALHVKLDVVQLLVVKGANVNGTNRNGVTVLHLAAKSGNLDVVQFLVDKGANVDAVDNYGRTILYWPVFFGKWDIVQFLEAKSAKVDD
ncbi:hypothetical protein ABEB36_000060 [Hypothenemus hampei]|uniref:Uncharacterized protein n=1 Tax=Hypothenemus hampei TaxID=57062 RepID=A0ABD1FA43_HYPHA